MMSSLYFHYKIFCSTVAKMSNTSMSKILQTPNGEEPAMFLQRPSSGSSQDVRHILARCFRDLYMREAVRQETVENLRTSKGGDDPYHERYVERLQGVSKSLPKMPSKLYFKFFYQWTVLCIISILSLRVLFVIFKKILIHYMLNWWLNYDLIFLLQPLSIQWKIIQEWKGNKEHFNAGCNNKIEAKFNERSVIFKWMKACLTVCW